MTATKYQITLDIEGDFSNKEATLKMFFDRLRTKLSMGGVSVQVTEIEELEKSNDELREELSKTKEELWKGEEEFMKIRIKKRKGR